MNTQFYDVMIVGAGPVGAVAALGLARAGLKVAIVDHADPQNIVKAGFDGRTSALSHVSRGFLEKIGFWEKIDAACERILDIHITDGNSPVDLHYDHKEVGDAPLGYIIENRLLRQELFAAMKKQKNISLYAPEKIITHQITPYDVQLGLQSGKKLHGGLLIGADGRKSAVRDWAGIKIKKWSYDQTSLVCCVTHDADHNHIAHERFLPAGPFAVLPMLGGKMSSIVWTDHPDVANAMLDLSDDDFNQEMTQRFGSFLGALKIRGKRWAYPLSFSHALCYAGNRVALIGDAAHGIHPIAGQGLNLGFGDVDVLLTHLIETRQLGLDVGDAMMLQNYDRTRRAQATQMTLATDGINKLFSNHSTMLAFLRGAGLSVVQKTPALRRYFIRRAGGG